MVEVVLRAGCGEAGGVLAFRLQVSCLFRQDLLLS